MIHELTRDSLSEIDEIGKAFAAEANYPGGWSLKSFVKLWELLLDADFGKIFTVSENGKLVGVLGAGFMEDPYSGCHTATEQFWYVLPTHRKTRVGLDLFDAFISEAAKRGMKKAVMVHLAALTPESLQRFYEKEGFRLAEQTFWKEL